MTYTIQLTSRARRQLNDLPREMVQRVAPVIDSLAGNPRPSGAKKLRAHEGHRIRVGDYRVLYTIDDTHHLVHVYRIGHQGDVYR